MSETSYLMNVYSRQNIRFTSGQGAYLIDEQGRRYLDAVAGIAVTSLGHAHSEIALAITAQAVTLIHTSNMYGIEWQEKLSEKLCRLAGMDKTFFCNSGAEANETALKLARLHAHRKGIQNPQIIVMEKSFHGRTLATLSASGNPKGQAGFGPLVDGFIRVPYNDIHTVEEIAASNPNVVAVLMEPVQGEGGVNVASNAYLSALRSVCDDHNWLLMIDEIQTGIGRTGQWFGFQHSNIQPDVITLAKALGNGVPIGACLARGQVADYFSPGLHGSTFGGNPLACRVGCKVLEVIEREKLVQRAVILGQLLQQQIQIGLMDNQRVIAVRSHGLMVGVELDTPCKELVAKCMTEENLLINVTRDTTVRLLPPLICTENEIIEMANKLTVVINKTFR